MLVAMHPLLEMLIDEQARLGYTDRKFAIEKLGITEDTYSNWKREFPSRLTKKSLDGISGTLDMTTEEILELV